MTNKTTLTLTQAYAKQVSGTWPTTWYVIPDYGTIWSTGNNSVGQLGAGDTVFKSSPTQIGTLSNWRLIAGGDASTLVIKTTGSLWATGLNSGGQLGNGTTVNNTSLQQIGALTTWASVAIGNDCALGISKSGALWSWGNNSTGRLGLGDTINRSSPVQVGTLTDWLKVSAGYSAPTVAIKTDGTLWTWGTNSEGQLGQGSTTNYNLSSPKQVGTLTDWKDIGSGRLSVRAIKTDGTLWVWGWGVQGHLGLGNTLRVNSPVQVGALTNWSIVASSPTQSALSAAIKINGTLWTWGGNAYGQLGLGDLLARSSPVQVGSSQWSKISLNGTAITAIKSDGTLWSWGRGFNGATGLGSTVNWSTPIQVGSSAMWVQTGGGNQFMFAVQRV